MKSLRAAGKYRIIRYINQNYLYKFIYLTQGGKGDMEWKSKIEDECCADELEEMITNYVKAGFWPNDKILMECEEYIKDFYSEEWGNITEDGLRTIIEALREEFQNTGNQENFLKLESAFQSLTAHGIAALHYAGFTQSDGFADCNEATEWMQEKGQKVIGCCFYTEQDLGHILQGDSTLLYLSFGNYFEKPTAEEIGQAIVNELKSVGFSIQWDGTAGTKIAIKDFKWDKYYTGSE